MPVNNFDNEMQEYFDSLPENLKQTIIMSDVKINSLQELKSIAQNFTGSSDET